MSTVESVRGDGFHLAQHPLERGAFAHDFFEGVFGADFLFQVELFVGKLVLEFGDFAIGEGVFNRNGHLVGHAHQEVEVLLREGARAEAGQAERAENPVGGDERHDAAGAETFGDEEAADVRLEAIDVGAGNDQRFARGDDLPGGRALEWDDHFFLEKAFALGEIERLQAKLLGSRIIKRQAGVFVIHHAPQAGGYGGKQLPQVERGDECVVDFQEQAQTVALAREFLLVDLGILKVQGIVDGDGHLRGYLLEELKVGGVVGTHLDRAQCHGAHPALGGGERQHAERAHAVLAQQAVDDREAIVVLEIGDYQRLLVLPNKLADVFLHGDFKSRLKAGWN